MTREIVFETPAGILKTTVRRLLCAGYTGRTRSLVDAHIEELKALGIGTPPHIPMLFPIISSLLTQAEATEVVGPNTAPEVEYVLFREGGLDYVTVGSDQTDSVMEGKAACLAKNLCEKSIARVAWPLSELLDHWDALELSLVCNGTTMQRGQVAAMFTPEQLRDFVSQHDGAEHENRMIFSGTLETHGRYPGGVQDLELELRDPVLGRSIRHAYRVTPLDEIFPAPAESTR
ncbi:hypothetical protein FHS85_005296 [Rhodoligotrophos appendicifer]|uniref:DUF2848 family protein n=1 Tax=Rhodoligotrophos appendicifer TaxID=987056 RepID=UPI001184CD69|nr:DUF2848 family protein [Rhodoligotrophos appendicifer]